MRARAASTTRSRNPSRSPVVAGPGSASLAPGAATGTVVATYEATDLGGTPVPAGAAP